MRGVVATDAQTPSLVLDAGTGLRNLTARLAGAPYQGSIVLSHLHWDHVQGSPFFPEVTATTPTWTSTSLRRTG